MHRNNLNLFIYEKTKNQNLILDESIPLRFFELDLDDDNAYLFLKRKDIPLQFIKRILYYERDHMSEILLSPSFTYEIFEYIYERAMQYDPQTHRYRKLYDLLDLIFKPDGSLMESYDAPIKIYAYHNDIKLTATNIKQLDKDIIYKCINEIIPICFISCYAIHPCDWKKMPVNISERKLRRYIKRSKNTDFQYKLIETKEWRYGEGYQYLLDDIDNPSKKTMRFKTLFRSLKHEIIELIKICFRFKIPQEILHMIAEYVLC